MPREKQYESAAERQRAYRARKNESVHFRSRSDMWATPQDLFDELNAEFGFTLDVCAEEYNAKCERYFTPKQDGLKQRWEGVCWMNPPYGRGVGEWIQKAKESAEQNGATVVCLMPARTDTSWWHQHILGGEAEVRFLKGRLKFGTQENSAPFPSVLVIFRGKETMTQAKERMTQELVPAAKKAIAAAKPENMLSPIVAASGESAARRFLEYFTVTIRNKNTRRAYWRACNAFLDYAESKGIVDLRHVEPMLVAAYIEKRTEHTGIKPPSPKQDLAAIRGLFDYLVTGGILPFNPAAAVKGPSYVVRRGKTPILSKADAKKLLESIPLTYKVKRADGVEEERADLLGLRDRALIALMIFTFARVGAATKMQVGDYYQNGKRWFVRLHEKGGKEHELPVHHSAEEYLDAYLKAAGIENQKKSPLFRTSPGRSRALSERSLTPEMALEMVKRRATQGGITAPVRNHTFRGTGITAYLESGGTIENAQAIANHADARTTKLYDRRGDRVSLDEIEKIQL